MATSYVFFATGAVVTPPYPPVRERLCTWLIRVLTGSRLAHCFFATEGVALDGCYSGNRYYNLKTAIRVYPTLSDVFKVTHPRRVDLDNWLAGVGIEKPLWPTIARWLRGGRGRWTADCLCVVLECLWLGGVPVPMTISTPHALHHWLKEADYEHLEVRSRGSEARAAIEHFCSD